MKPWLKAAICVLTGLAASGSASAAFIDLTGSGPQPANAGNAIQPWLNGLVTSYNTANDPDLPAPNLVEAFRNNQGQNNGPPGGGFPQFGNNITSLDIPVGSFEYLVLHWGGPNNGPAQNNQTPGFQAFYIGNPMGASTITVDNNPDQHGLSWYALYNPKRTPPDDPPPSRKVPDGGTTLLALGMGLFGLGFVKRFVVKSA